MPQPQNWFQLHVDCRNEAFDGPGFASLMISVIDRVADQAETNVDEGIVKMNGLAIGVWSLYGPGANPEPLTHLEREFTAYINCDGEPFDPSGSDRHTVIASALRSLRGQLATGRWNGAFILEHRHTFGNWATKWSRPAQKR